MSFLATTSGASGEDIRDLMLAAVEHRFGLVNRLPVTIEWLSDNGSYYVAGETRSFARDIGLEPRTTPIESPQSNGMAEAFVRTIKRDYVHVSPCPDAQTVMHQLSAWINHYNEVHPHKALGYRSPREFIAAHDRVRSFGGYNMADAHAEKLNYIERFQRSKRVWAEVPQDCPNSIGTPRYPCE